LAINGKFLTAGPTGVHRVAEQLVRQLAYHRDELAEVFEKSPRLIAPRKLQITAPESFEIERGGVFRGQLWEQLDLPRLASSDLLLNLCNLGPMTSRAAITMVHDAQVFLTPESYSWAFANWYRQVLPVIGRRHLRILTVSEFSADQLARYGVAQRGRISVVPNGVDHLLNHEPQPGILDRLALVKRKFVIGLANVQAHKNVRLLLEAFTAPALQDLRLVLVGSALRGQFERLGHFVPRNVVFAGSVSDGELRGLLEAALCVGFPSTTEGFGLPPLEGMLFGCPAIMAPCGALPEVGGEHALFASPDEPRQWISAIRKLADEPDHWSSYSRAGRARACQFTWQRAGKKLIEIINDVAIERAAKHQ
jgi:glycosyltransferase involved in cell wall biosynthesis